MTEERLEEIFAGDSDEWDGDNCFQGLLIIAKYVDPTEKEIIVGAGHDQIYSVDIDKIIEAGITEEDAKKLRGLNWMLSEGEYLSCFV